MYLLRHGQSHFNVTYSATRVDPDIPDPELTDDGRRQAEEAAQQLRGQAIDRILCSPYTRTLQTADIVADALKLPIAIEPLIREHAYFSCDIGTPCSKLSAAWPHLDFGALQETWWPEESETEAQVRERCRLFFHKMADLADWSRVLVVSHWAFFRGLTGVEMPNGGVLRVDLHDLAFAKIGV